jgi:homocysteine S-methyltransferase
MLWAFLFVPLFLCLFGTFDRDLSVVTTTEMEELMKVSVRLAKEAVHNSKAFVVASSGCYGAALADGSEYTGEYPNMTLDGLTEFHRKKMTVYLNENPDGLAIETIPSIEECAAVCLALKSMPSHSACCWISMACRDGTTLNEGKPFVDALKAIREQDPDAQYVHAIGINCCDIFYIPSLLEILVLDMARNGPRRGIVIYPNSGEEWEASTAQWRQGTGCTGADEFSSRLMGAVYLIERLWKENSRDDSLMPNLIIGGCCRTSPATISALRQQIDQWHLRPVPLFK